MPARFCGPCGASLPDLQDLAGETDPWIGRVVDRRYKVLSRVGAGGMGLVYRVEHIQLGKIAAMKVLHAETARDGEAVRRFRNEAQAVSRLSHPNIVQTFDFGQSEGSLYLVMEYVRGDDLATMVKRDGPMRFDRAVPLFVQICSALTEAHDSGVIHRDLKPENIVVVARRDGTVHAKVLDFGLAKLRERSDGADITSGGVVIGTPHYMSPEQVRCEPLDVRTDIYSLGATMYRVLTGTPPFEAPTPVGVLTMHITDTLEPPRARAPDLNLPPEADAIVARAMAKSREDRYASAADVQRDLEAALVAARRSSARPASPAGPRLVPAARRDRTTAHAPTVALGADDVPAPAEQDNDGSDSLPVAGDERLRRQDFDAFERSLRRKKIVASLIVPAVLLLAVAAGVFWSGRAHEKPSSVEREPNNSPAEATLLPGDSPVQGNIGKRLSEGQPDMDYFRVPAGKGARVVSARVEGVPGVDLVLELFDGQGTPLAKSDSRGAGSGEWLQPVAVGPADAYLLVRQVWIQGTNPLEDVADPYRIVVHWGPPASGWEVEPNDWPERANPVARLSSVKGYLAGADDKDWFVFTPAKNGQVIARVAPPSGVAIVLLDAGGVAEGPRRAAGGKMEKSPNKPPEVKAAVKAGEPFVIGLAREQIAREATEDRDVKLAPVVGLDDPYELKIELLPSP
ncbi:MAG: protein kinase [Pseudomonadota bacterium]